MLNPFEVLKIEKNKIFTKYDCIITLNLDEYEDDITETTTKYLIPGIVEIYIPELEDYAQIITSYNQIGLLKSNEYEETDDEITLNYSANDLIIEQEFSEIGGGFGGLKKVLEGKLTYIKTPEGLLNMFHANMPASDLCHLELIISNMLKDSDGNLCRMSGNFKNFEQVGILKQAKTDSWLSGIAFQNIEHAINRALIKKEDAKMNPIEKILNEDFDI